MAEATPTKRVLPARDRAESSAKKRNSSPAAPATPVTEPRQKRKYTKRASLNKASTPTTGTPTPSTISDGFLPHKVYSAKPLPTSAQKQSDKLSNMEYQSIAESAVLVASLHRSRMQWLCDGVFKRYWTKPVKRKGVIEQPPGNPDVKSMSKLGNATMTIEPHLFDVTFYTVKDLSMTQPPQQRHPNQHTVKQANSPHPVQPLAQPLLTQPTPLQIDPAHEAATAALPDSTAAVTASPSTATPVTVASDIDPSTSKPDIAANNISLKQEEANVPQIKVETPLPPTNVSNFPPLPIAHPPTQSIAPVASSSALSGAIKPATDPVIQMLAKRAASDNALKELMKIVATSQASREQLREFQAHIDEFNQIVKQQEAKKAEEEKRKKALSPMAVTGAAHPAAYGTPTRPLPGPSTVASTSIQMAPPTLNTYPQPRAEPFIKHIVMEFHSPASASLGPSTDRWLFPEHAILDIKSGGMEMVASFFVVQKGEDILARQRNNGTDESISGSKFKADMEYYEPVTILVKATQHKTIETIARAAKPLVHCQNHMKEVMDTKTRAPQEYLMHQLPRERTSVEKHGTDFVDSAVEMSNEEDDELRDFYGV